MVTEIVLQFSSLAFLFVVGLFFGSFSTSNVDEIFFATLKENNLETILNIVLPPFFLKLGDNDDALKQANFSFLVVTSPKTNC